MLVVHLTSSTFLGGPERQMLGLGQALAPAVRSAYLSFAEGGRCRAFVTEARQQDFAASALVHDTPQLRAAVRELVTHLRDVAADVLLCHGYKADLLGRIAARRARIPVVAVSRGWTGENLKVRAYEWLDRINLFGMDRVVCVSEGQAAKVRRLGLPERRLRVIRNAIRGDRFGEPDPAYHAHLHGLFPQSPGRIVGAAGRLSPEKGFDVFVAAAAQLARMEGSTGFVLFGDGPLRDALERQAAAAGLEGRLVFAGFRKDLDGFLPWLDLLVLPSYTEGLPNVVLEGCAAGVPVVATAVGGTPEVIEDGVTGCLVPPGDAAALARRMLDVLHSPDGGRALAERGRQRVRAEFTFAAQAARYRELFAELLDPRPSAAASRTVLVEPLLARKE
jgi:glycosyltransferase involved in cell wall biosynthesis